jgi:hypothetical protein
MVRGGVNFADLQAKPNGSFVLEAEGFIYSRGNTAQKRQAF